MLPRSKHTMLLTGKLSANWQTHTASWFVHMPGIFLVLLAPHRLSLHDFPPLALLKKTHSNHSFLSQWAGRFPCGFPRLLATARR